MTLTFDHGEGESLGELERWLLDNGYLVLVFKACPEGTLEVLLHQGGCPHNITHHCIQGLLKCQFETLFDLASNIDDFFIARFLFQFKRYLTLNYLILINYMLNRAC